MSLTKARLSAMVVVTTVFGYFLRAGQAGVVEDPMRMVHTVIGTTFAALGAAVFNQLMEISPDAKMRRTESRPLPANRIPPAMAFGLGFLLSGFALVHLGQMVNMEAVLLTALTIAVYIFVYTPMKQRSGLNTLVGAVSGAIPPVIGWVGAAGPPPEGIFLRFWLLFEPGAIFLFGLLFFWQLPHFVAINWIYREEYIKGGFKMWANDDESGEKTGKLAVLFSLCLLATMAIPPIAGDTSWWFTIPAVLLTVPMVALAVKFSKEHTVKSARTLFFYTLIYLPLILAAALLLWNPKPLPILP